MIYNSTFRKYGVKSTFIKRLREKFGFIFLKKVNDLKINT